MSSAEYQLNRLSDGGRLIREHHPQYHDIGALRCHNEPFGSIPAQASSNLDTPIPQKGSIYPDFEALRYSISIWALRDKFSSRIYKKDSTRAIYVCQQSSSSGCTWRVRANISKEHSGAVLVTVVQPRHTCNVNIPGEGGRNAGSDSRPKYARRGVQFTQRWVRDALVRCGFNVSHDTEPKAIVSCIEKCFGEAITEKLALKSKNSLLVARGEMIPQKFERPGRPSRAEIEERKRDMSAAIASQQDDIRDDQVSDVCRGCGFGLGPTDIARMNGIERNVKAPNTNFRSEDCSLGYNTGKSTNRKGISYMSPTDLRCNSMTINNTDPSAHIPTNLDAEKDLVNYTPPPSSSSANLVRNSAFVLPQEPSTRQCEACSGTGTFRYNQYHNPPTGLDENYSRLRGTDEELFLLEKQMKVLQKQVEVIRERRMSCLSQNSSSP